VQLNTDDSDLEVIQGQYQLINHYCVKVVEVQMCVDSQFQTDGAAIENELSVKRCLECGTTKSLQDADHRHVLE